MLEEELQKITEWWDGLDDEISPLAPSLECLADLPMFSPQEAFTGSCADQVLFPLIGDQCEWASFSMYSPQRSPTGWCANQEQSPEDKMLSNFVVMENSVTIGNSNIKGSVMIGTTMINWFGHASPVSLVQMLSNISVHPISPGSKSTQVGYPLEGRCVEVDNLMEENIGQIVERAEKSCIAISDSKKKNKTETPKRSYRTKRLITLDDLRQHFGLKRVEAAKRLGVSVPTFKRSCRQNGITWWNGDGCSLVEPKLLNNSVHQNSPGSKPLEVEGEKETSTLLIAKQDVVTVKAKYGERTLKFWLSMESGVAELNEAVAKRVELELGNFIVEYEDEDQERVWIACDEDLQECVKFSSSLGNQVIRLLVTDKVFNSKKSHESCEGLKRKRS